jgi:hypothetical protein
MLGLPLWSDGDVGGNTPVFWVQSPMPTGGESHPVKLKEASIVGSEAVAGRRGCSSFFL